MQDVYKVLSNIGIFEVISESLIITDPNHSPDDDAQVELKNVKNGQWKAYTMVREGGIKDPRVKELIVVYNGLDPNKAQWRLTGMMVDIDSNKIGIYDSAEYGSKFVDDILKTDWQKRQEELLYESGEGGGSYEGGCVAAPGDGPGTYTVLIASNRGVVIGIKILFIID